MSIIRQYEILGWQNIHLTFIENSTCTRCYQYAKLKNINQQQQKKPNEMMITSELYYY